MSIENHRDSPLDLPEPAATPADPPIPAANPFVLPDLPEFVGMPLASVPASPEVDERQDEHAHDPHDGYDDSEYDDDQPEYDEDDGYDGYDDQDEHDAVAAAWARPPAVVPLETETDPQIPPAPSGTTARSGAWDEWLARPARAGQSATEWDIPDYDLEDDPETLARRNVVDRTGRKPVIGGARRRDPDDGPRKVYTARSTGLAVLTVAGVAIVVTAAIVVNVSGLNGDGPLASETTATTTGAGFPSTTAAAEIWGHATANCRATQTSTLTVGAGPGDPATAAGAILGFEWAYYVSRNAARAREFVAADAAVPPATEIQAGIDAVPHGTKYCVYATDQGAGVWHVELHEQYPSEASPQKFAQTVTTREENGRTLITAITSR